MQTPLHPRTSANNEASVPHETRADAKDIRDVAEQFPLLINQKKLRRPLVFLDNSSTTQKPQCVLDALNSYYCHYNANPSRGVYHLGQESTRLYSNARRMVAQFIHAESDEVIFTSGATEALNIVAYAFGSQVLSAGDQIVLPVSEHHSNLIPWQTIAKQTGAKLVYLFPNEEGCIPEQMWREALTEKTKIVAVAHVSNVLGSVAPLKTIAALAHEVGAYVVADCAQSVAHRLVDVKALDVDFAAFSGHKMYAPMGIGVLYGKKELLERMPPLMRGGGMVENVFEGRAEFAEIPTCFEAGTPHVAGAAGLAEAIHFVTSLGYDQIQRHEIHLLQRMLSGLAAIPDVEIYGQKTLPTSAGTSNLEPSLCGVVAFNVKGVDSLDTAEALARDNIAIRAGAHCAEPLIRHLGVKATCRASIALYNSESDIDTFLNAVESAKRTAAIMILSSMH